MPQDRLQFHHIFPKAVLKAVGRSPREADDIANLSFISGKTNPQISDKAPAEYLVKYGAGPAGLDAQCVPTRDDLLQVDAYREFLAERRHRIAARLNEFLGTHEAI